jgi:hypothetical protein
MYFPIPNKLITSQKNSTTNEGKLKARVQRDEYQRRTDGVEQRIHKLLDAQPFSLQ